MPRFAFAAFLSCAVTVSTLCIAQTAPTRICVVLSSQDEFQNTLDHFVTIIDQKQTPGRGSVVAIALEASKKQVVSEIQKQKCEYVVALTWVNLQSLEVTALPDALHSGLIPIASNYEQRYQAFSLGVVQSGSFLGYRLEQRGHKKPLLSGMLRPFQPPVGIDSALDRLAELVAAKLAH